MAKGTTKKTKRSTSAPRTSPRPRARASDIESAGAVARGNRAREREAREDAPLASKREAGGAMKAKKKMAGGTMKAKTTKKYAKGGTARGMGAATKGGKYSRSC